MPRKHGMISSKKREPNDMFCYGVKLGVAIIFVDFYCKQCLITLCYKIFQCLSAHQYYQATKPKGNVERI